MRSLAAARAAPAIIRPTAAVATLECTLPSMTRSMAMVRASVNRRRAMNMGTLMPAVPTRAVATFAVWMVARGRHVRAALSEGGRSRVAQAARAVHTDCRSAMVMGNRKAKRVNRS